MNALDTFLSTANFIADIVTVLVIMDILALFLLLFLERYDPRTFMAWLILLFFLPPVGFILYMYMGMAIYKKSQFKPKSLSDKQMVDADEHRRNT